MSLIIEVIYQDLVRENQENKQNPLFQRFPNLLVQLPPRGY